MVKELLKLAKHNKSKAPFLSHAFENKDDGKGTMNFNSNMPK